MYFIASAAFRDPAPSAKLILRVLRPDLSISRFEVRPVQSLSPPTFTLLNHLPQHHHLPPGSNGRYRYSATK